MFYALVHGQKNITEGNPKHVEVIERKKVALDSDTNYHLYINSKRNVAGLCRSIFYLTSENGEIFQQTCLLQYHISGAETVDFDIEPHGNRKHGNRPFYPTQKSTMVAMKEQLSGSSASQVFKNHQ